MFAAAEAFCSFSVDDIDVARRFYGGTLGLDLEEITVGFAINIRGARVAVVYLKGDHQPATYTTLCFRVDDLVATVTELEDRGVRLETYEGAGQDARGIARGFGPMIAWVKDPAGN